MEFRTYFVLKIQSSTHTEFGWPVPVKESNKKDTGNENTNKQNGGPDGPFVILRSPAFPRLQIYLLH